MKKKWHFTIVCTIIIGICIFLFYPRTVFPDLEHVNKIFICYGNDGRSVSITDTEELNEIISELAGLTMHVSHFAFGRGGWSYSVIGYHDDDIVFQRLITGDNRISEVWLGYALYGDCTFPNALFEQYHPAY